VCVCVCERAADAGMNSLPTSTRLVQLSR
jgi:hypothetical protein